MKKNDRYVIFELRQGSDVPSRRVALDRRRTHQVGLALGITALVLLLVAGGLGIQQLRRARALTEENLQLSQRLEGLDRRVELAEGGLARIQAHDAKLRSLTHADEGVRPYGIGPLDELEIQTLRAGADATLPTGVSRTAVVIEASTSLEERVDRLAEELATEEISLQEVRGYLVTRDALLDAYPTAWPTDGWVTSRYGFRRSPLPGSRPFHTGIDIASAYGTPIRATADGVVTSARFRDAYGWTVEIDHGFGIGTLYAHCSRLLVSEGDEVSRGDVIARLGSTGRATGPHIHYEVLRDGVPVNPEGYLVGDIIRPPGP